MKNTPMNMDLDKYALDPLSDDEIRQHSDFIMIMLKEIARGATVSSFFRNNAGSNPFGETRMRLTLSCDPEAIQRISVDSSMIEHSRDTVGDGSGGSDNGAGVVALQSAYSRARAGFIDAKFDELFDMFDDPHLIEDPRRAVALKGKSDNIKWALAKLKPQKYGDKIQVEHTVDVDVVDRLQAGRDRAAALSNETHDDGA